MSQRYSDLRSSRAEQSDMYHFQGSQQNNNNSPRGRRSRNPRGFDFRARRPRISERALFTTSHNASEDLTFPGNKGKSSYRNVDDLSDTDEAEMDMSDLENDPRPAKRTKVQSDDNNGKVAPRWSNPDPYTALPPTDDPGRKSKDVLKLIRKARVSTSASNGESVANNEDFISFEPDLGNTDSDNVVMLGSHRVAAPANAPTGPKGMSNGVARDAHTSAKNNTALGKRKRQNNGDTPALVRNRGTQYYTDAMILDDWRASGAVSASPWLPSTRSQALEPPGITLHKEVMDFYEWIKPRDYEQGVRADVISRLQRAFERLEPGGQLRSFGSFAAGLYLPTGDMDLVFLRPSFRGTRINANGQIAKPNMGMFHTFDNFIRNKGIARPGSIVKITGAKVPIIKFVEQVSGLKIDLCFDNDTGVLANPIFDKWKAEYPTMPILVSLIKHFLMIRGLNDVSVGGIGGFSIICLVTSLCQHMPQTGRVPNLGNMLLEFFNLYGNLFNRHEVVIRMDPPAYIDKRDYSPFIFSNDKPDRLSIIDPNRPDNNISGGTRLIELIFKAFSTAHSELQVRLEDCLSGPEAHASLLEGIMGNEFTAYEDQRRSLFNVYNSTIGQSSTPQLLPPPPPPTFVDYTAQAPPPPPPMLNSNHDQITLHRTSGRTAQNLSMESGKPSTVGVAVELGGYSDSHAMALDLDRLAKEQKGDKHQQKLGREQHSSFDPVGFVVISSDGDSSSEEVLGEKPKRKVKNKTIETEARARQLQRLRPDIPGNHELKEISKVQGMELGGYKSVDAMFEDLNQRVDMQGLCAAVSGETAGHVWTEKQAGGDLDGDSPTEENGTQSIVYVHTGKGQLKKTRALKLQRLRLNIPSIQNFKSINHKDAAEIGGYANTKAMNADLETRAKEQNLTF